MSHMEVSGGTQEQIDEIEAEFNERPEADLYDFSERFCLCPIPNQPDDYDGPQRYCRARASHKSPNKWEIWRCRKHKNRGVSPTPENLEKYPNLKHSMRASYQCIRDTLDEEEKEVFNGIMRWAEVYGIDKEEEPAAHDLLVMLAHERVRSIRTGDYLNEEGELVEKPRFTDDGTIIVDEEGNPETEDEQNPISDAHRQLIKLVKDLMKELVLTPKERMKADDRNVMAESADTTSDAMRELVADDDKEFDIDDYDV